MAAYSFSGQRAVGAMGVTILTSFFERRGWSVVSVEGDKDWQRRDVDLLVNGRATEVKTDTHTTGKLFLELTCDDKPGCVFKSRAEVWCYYFPHAGQFYLIELPKLQLWLCRYASSYALKRVKSTQSGRVWYSEGIVVPLETLEEALIAHLFVLDRKEAEEVGSNGAGSSGDASDAKPDTGKRNPRRRKAAPTRVRDAV